MSETKGCTIDYRSGESLNPPPTRWAQRWVPGHGATYIHGYTGADMARIKQAAHMLAGDAPPSDEQLAVAQVLFVCRTGPNSDECTFQVSLPNVEAAARDLTRHLPGRWIDAVCALSDQLTLQDFLPPLAEHNERVDTAARRLGEQLGDPEVWHALSLLSLKLYGVPLAENDRPLDEVLNHLERDLAMRRQMAESLAPLAMVAEGEVG